MEKIQQMIIMLLHIAELDMINSVAGIDIVAFLTNVSWVIFSTYNTELKVSQDALSLVGIFCSTFPQLLAGTRIETADNVRKSSLSS